MEIKRALSVLPAFACSIMQSVKELELAGGYNILSAVICPSACDTLKAIGQKWSCGDVPMMREVMELAKKVRDVQSTVSGGRYQQRPRPRPSNGLPPQDWSDRRLYRTGC